MSGSVWTSVSPSVPSLCHCEVESRDVEAFPSFWRPYGLTREWGEEEEWEEAEEEGLVGGDCRGQREGSVKCGEDLGFPAGAWACGGAGGVQGCVHPAAPLEAQH